jgi:hypothetical protein
MTKYNKHQHVDFMSKFKTAAKYIHHCYHNSNRPNIHEKILCILIITASIIHHSMFNHHQTNQNKQQHGIGNVPTATKQQHTTMFHMDFRTMLIRFQNCSRV